MNITITDKAKAMLGEKVSKESFLRVTVVEGGCAGMTYNAEIDDKMLEGESVILQTNEFRIISDQNSEQYLEGLTIDYSDDLISGGLRFDNPKGTSCECGSSFGLAGFPTIGEKKCGH